MTTTSRSFFLTLCVCAVAYVSGSAAQAASISYGDKSAPPLVFQNIIESSGTDSVPLYGDPAPFAVGLDFDPTSFVANSVSGGADITDGQLNFRIMDAPGGQSWGIRSLALNEFGDYTLAGTGTAATGIIAGANMFVTVREVNGTAVSAFTVSGVDSFADDLSGGTEFLQTWSNDVLVDLGPALTSRGYASNAVVTKADIVLNNSLIAFSEANSVSFIAKKDFVISTTPRPNPEEIIPEPTSMALCGLALCGLGAARRRG